MVSPLDDLITREDIVEVAVSEALVFDDEDRISILQAMRSIDVQASPGSGKTTLVAAKLILLARKWPYKDRGICVLSHTNVAKDEIIERLVASRYPEAKSPFLPPFHRHYPRICWKVCGFSISSIQRSRNSSGRYRYMCSDALFKADKYDTHVC